MQNESIKRMKTELEELEKRIYSLFKNKVSLLRVDEIQALLTNLQTNLSNLETTVNSNQMMSLNNYSQLNNDLTTLENLTNTINSQVELNVDSIDDILTNIHNIQQAIVNIQSSVNNLSLVATSGDYYDLNNIPPVLTHTCDEGYLYFGVYSKDPNVLTDDPTTITPLYYFTCNINLPILIELTFKCQAYMINQDNNEGIIRITINDNIVYEVDVILDIASIISYCEITIPFRPKTTINKIRIQPYKVGSAIFIFEAIKYKITGANPFMLKADNTYEVMAYKNEFYFTEPDFLSNSFVPHSYSVTNEDRDTKTTLFRDHFNKILVKRLICNVDGYLTEVDGAVMGLVKHLNSFDYRIAFSFIEYLNIHRSLESMGYSMSCFKPYTSNINNSTKYISAMFCLNNLIYCLFISNRPVPLKLNGESLNPEWIDTCGVWQMDMENETYYPFRGLMAQRMDGEYFYFPEIDSTYCVHIGRGRGGKLIKRKGSETLYAYISDINKVTQYILTKDQNGIYSVTSSSEVYGITNYTETLCDVAIVTVGQETKYIEPLFD